MTTMNNEDPADPSVHEQRQAPKPPPKSSASGFDDMDDDIPF